MITTLRQSCVTDPRRLPLLGPTLVSMLALSLALGPGAASAAVIVLNTSDSHNAVSGISNSSFTDEPGGGPQWRWVGGAPPVAGNDYQVGTGTGTVLFTPDSTADYTFKGNSLLITGSASRLSIRGSGLISSNLTLDNNASVWNIGPILGGPLAVQLGGVITVGSGGAIFDSRQGNVGRSITIRTALQDQNPASPGTVTIRSAAGASTLASNGFTAFDVAQTYRGDTVIDAGAILRQNGANFFSSGGNGVHTVNGMLNLNNFNAAINGLAGGATVTATNGRVLGGTATSLTLDGETGSQTFSGVIEGTALDLTKTGGSRQVLAGTNTYGGTTTISGGQLQAGSNNALSGSAVTVNGTGTLEIGAGVNLANTVALTSRGDATTAHIAAAGANATQSGAVTANGSGNFNLSGGATSGQSLTVIGNLTGADVGGQTLNLLGATGTAGTLSGTTALTGAGTDTIAKSGAGTWTISGGTTADALSVADGTLNLTTLGRSFNTVGVTGGVLNVGSALTAGTATVSGGTMNVNAASTATTATVSGSGTMNVNAATGATTANVSSGALNLSAALNTGNAVAVSGGTVTQTGSRIDRTAQTGGYNVTGGSVNLNGSAASITALNGTGGSVTSTSAAALTLGNASANAGYGGTLTGNLSLVKDLANTQTLTGTNTYTGGTTVSGGVLALANGGTAGTGTVGIAGTGTLELANSNALNDFGLTGRTGGDAAIAHIDSTAGDNTVGGTGDTMALVGGGNFNLASSGTATGDQLTVAAAITDTGSADDTLNLSGAGDGEVTGGITLDSGNDQIVKSGTGKWTLSNTVAVDDLTMTAGQMLLSGGTTAAVAVQGGSLTLGNNLNTTAEVSISAGATLAQTGGSWIDRTRQTGRYLVDGILDLGGANASINRLDGSGRVRSTAVVDPDLTIGSNGADGSFGGVIEDGGTEALNVIKDGSNTQTLSGTNTYTGFTRVEGGVLRVASNSALGATTTGTTVQGTGRVDIGGASNLTVGESFSLQGRTGTTVHLNNVAGSNAVGGAVTLTDNPGGSGTENYGITSAGGTLALNGGVASALSDGVRVLTLGGAGNGTISGLALTGAAEYSVVKTGDGNWTINGTGTNIANAQRITTQSGVLTLAGATAIGGTGTIIQIDDNATMNVAGVTGGVFGLSASQIMQGEGTVVGTVNTAATSTVAPATAGTTGKLDFDGNLTMAGVLNIDIFSLTATDLLDVSGALTISNASLALNLGSLAYNTYYVFANYGSLDPTLGPFASVSGLGSYEIIYDYNNGSSIALYTGPEPVPVPAPLTLIGLGLFGLAALRRRRAA